MLLQQSPTNNISAQTTLTQFLKIDLVNASKRSSQNSDVFQTTSDIINQMQLDKEIIMVHERQKYQLQPKEFKIEDQFQSHDTRKIRQGTQQLDIQPSALSISEETYKPFRNSYGKRSASVTAHLNQRTKKLEAFQNRSTTPQNSAVAHQQQTNSIQMDASFGQLIPTPQPRALSQLNTVGQPSKRAKATKAVSKLAEILKHAD